MEIVRASLENASDLAIVVSESNKGVAEQFGINADNNPKHPSFYTKEWVISDFDRGEEYFLLTQYNKAIGCVAFEQPRSDTAYLNRLSILPNHRHKGAGELLVRHIFKYAREKDIVKVSIGIIASHDILKSWYISLGFVETHTRNFEHLPFDVTYMHYEL
jgi:ribosomal protein S18 acetylase RimI-like enzyme